MINPLRTRWRVLVALVARFKRVEDVLRFAGIAGFALIVPLLMRLHLARLQSLLEPGTAPVAAAPERVDQIVAFVEAAIALGRPLIRPICLTRGLTYYYFLRRAGVDLSLVFGTGRPQNTFAGHCWLVRDGLPYLENTDPRPLFVELYRYSPRGLLLAAPTLDNRTVS